MQTFLPYSDFVQSARVLDRQRLGKQRVECLQLLKGQWPHHPVAKMWAGHRLALVQYARAVCQEWTGRGYVDNCLKQIETLALDFPQSESSSPAWLGRADFHLAHQSNLVRKKPDHYRQYFPTVPNDLPYIWPV